MKEQQLLTILVVGITFTIVSYLVYVSMSNMNDIHANAVSNSEQRELGYVSNIDNDRYSDKNPISLSVTESQNKEELTELGRGDTIYKIVMSDDGCYAKIYLIGPTSGDNHFTVLNLKTQECKINLE